MSSSFKQKLQLKMVLSFCAWVEKSVEGKSAEEVMAFFTTLGQMGEEGAIPRQERHFAFPQKNIA